MKVQKTHIIGRRLQYEHLNSVLYKKNKKMYMLLKAYSWLSMLQNGERPTNWSQADKDGTKVKFDKLHTKEEIDYATKEFQKYIDVLNKEYNLELILDK